MKKSILALAVLATATFASAQEASTGGYKAVSGSKTLEFGFAPLGGSPISISGVQFRSFMSDKMALRANIFLGFSSNKEVTNPARTGGVPGSNATETTTKTSSMEIGLMPGVEMHMAGTDRLSPYWGLVLDIGFGTSKEVAEERFANSTTGDEDSLVTTTTKGEDGFLRLGLMMPIGFDYYIAKNLYLGAEMGIGVGFRKGSKTTIEVDPSTPLPTGAPTTEDQKGETDINFGPTVNGRLRLGFAF